MISTGAAKPVVQPDMPKWTAQDQFFKTRRWMRLLTFAVLVLWIMLLVWVLILAPISDNPAATLETGANLTLVLAPVLAAAAAVERTLETLFNMVENGWRTLVAYLGHGLRWLKSAEVEVKQARQFMEDVSEKYHAEMQALQLGRTSASTLAGDLRTRMDAANSVLGLAQARLADAENNLAAAPASDSYKSAKAAASIVLGLLLGVIIAAIGQLQMFAMLGIGAVPPRIDVLITGLAIGSGSYPVHSLLGILQQGKNTLDSVQGYYSRLAPTAQAIQQRIRTIQAPAAPGEAPRVQESVIETTQAQSTEEKPQS